MVNLERTLDWLVRPNTGFPNIIKPGKVSLIVNVG